MTKKQTILCLILFLTISLFASSKVPDLAVAVQMNEDGYITSLFGLKTFISEEEVFKTVSPIPDKEWSKHSISNRGKFYKIEKMPYLTDFFDSYHITVDSYWGYWGNLYCKKTYAPSDSKQRDKDFDKLSKMLTSIYGEERTGETWKITDDWYTKQWGGTFNTWGEINAFLSVLGDELMLYFNPGLDNLYLLNNHFSRIFGIPKDLNQLDLNSGRYTHIGNTLLGTEDYWAVPQLPDARLTSYRIIYKEGSLYCVACYSNIYSDSDMLLDVYKSLKEDLDSYANRWGYEIYDYSDGIENSSEYDIIESVFQGNWYQVNYGGYLSKADPDSNKIFSRFELYLKAYSETEADIHVVFWL